MFPHFYAEKGGIKWSTVKGCWEKVICPQMGMMLSSRKCNRDPMGKGRTMSFLSKDCGTHLLDADITWTSQHTPTHKMLTSPSVMIFSNHFLPHKNYFTPSSCIKVLIFSVQKFLAFHM
jgi:hypothetical protein